MRVLCHQFFLERQGPLQRGPERRDFGLQRRLHLMRGLQRHSEALASPRERTDHMHQVSAWRMVQCGNEIVRADIEAFLRIDSDNTRTVVMLPSVQGNDTISNTPDALEMYYVHERNPTDLIQAPPNHFINLQYEVESCDHEDSSAKYTFLDRCGPQATDMMLNWAKARRDGVELYTQVSSILFSDEPLDNIRSKGLPGKYFLIEKKGREIPCQSCAAGFYNAKCLAFCATVSWDELRSFHQWSLRLRQLLPENGCGQSIRKGRFSSARGGGHRGNRQSRVRRVFMQWPSGLRRGAAVCRRLNGFARTGKIVDPHARHVQNRDRTLNLGWD